VIFDWDLVQALGVPAEAVQTSKVRPSGIYARFHRLRIPLKDGRVALFTYMGEDSEGIGPRLLDWERKGKSTTSMLDRTARSDTHYSYSPQDLGFHRRGGRLGRTTLYYFTTYPEMESEDGAPKRPKLEWSMLTFELKGLPASVISEGPWVKYKVSDCRQLPTGDFLIIDYLERGKRIALRVIDDASLMPIATASTTTSLHPLSKEVYWRSSKSGRWTRLDKIFSAPAGARGEIGIGLTNGRVQPVPLAWK
jgi:hypothetical protein